MRTYALWRAERGANLGILELLNGSQNLLSAFERAILLPGLGFLSIVVMLLWALSPVGGQSALRVLSRKSLSSWDTIIIYYFNNTAVSEDEGAWESKTSFRRQENSINAIFAASITSLERVKGRDIWGNVKIPVLQYVHSYIVDQSKDGWYDFDENNYDSSYSSLIGIVVSGLRKGMETNFVIESFYFNLTCTEPVFFERNSIGGEEFATWVGTLYHRWDNSFKLWEGDSLGWSSYMIDTNYVYKPYIVVEPRYNIIYAFRANEDEIAAYNCTVGLFHVESEVTCGSDCHVKRVRPSRNAIWSDSGYPWPGSWAESPAVLLHWLDTFNTQPSSTSTCPLDFYVRGFDDPYSHDLNAPISYRNVSGLNVAKRLQSLINTGWQLGFQGPATAKKSEENGTVLMSSVGINYTNFDIDYQISSTNATTIEKHDVFVSHKIWIAVTMVVSFILLLCGFLSMIFKYGINSPDVLGYVSSMTRDNPNFVQIPDGDRLDGFERARVLRHLKVQIVDVKPWDSDGYVTLKPLDQLKK